MADRTTLLRKGIRQLRVAARMDLTVLLTSKRQAAMWLVTDFISYTAGITAVLLVAERFDGIAGWSRANLMFLVGFGTTSAALRQVFFGYNLNVISRRVGRGQLDHTLVQPQPMVLSFATEGFSPFSSMGALVPGVVLLASGAAASEVDITAAFVARLGASVAASMVIVLSGSFAIGAAAFWAPRGAEEISTRASSLLSLTDFPLDPLPIALRTVLLTVIPGGFVAWFPAAALLGRRPEWQWVLTVAVAIVSAAAATTLFRKGLRRYAQTGSSRYSTFGHRR